MTFIPLFSDLGLSPNEALIYEALLRHGELGVSDAARFAGAHRRNVYDALLRLVDKGLVFEIMDGQQCKYQAAEPKKLLDILDEKRTRLTQALPEIERVFQETPAYESVVVYRGIEGLKNYMRDIIRVGEDYYSIGAKGIWADPRLSGIFPSFLRDAERKNITFHILFDYAVFESRHAILEMLPGKLRILPKTFEAPSSLGTFGDMTVVFSNINVGKMAERITLTVIRDINLATTIRAWFKALWPTGKPLVRKQNRVSLLKIKKSLKAR